MILEKIVQKYPQDGYFMYLLGRTNYKLGHKDTGLHQVMTAYELTKNNVYLEIYYQMKQGAKIQ
jgi:hypothetical protein